MYELCGEINRIKNHTHNAHPLRLKLEWYSTKQQQTVERREEAENGNEQHQQQQQYEEEEKN